MRRACRQQADNLVRRIAPLAAAVAVAALTGPTYAASVAWGQTAGGDSAAPGVVVTFSYSGELVGNAAGGARLGATFAGLAGVQATFLLGRLVRWHGASAFLFGLGTHGGAPSDLVGDVQGVSNLEAPSMLRLEEAWLQQNLFENHLSWLAGRYDLNSEFYRLQSGALFLNSSFGIGPEFAQSGVAGPSIYPSTAIGTRLSFKPSENLVLRVAVLDGVPADRSDDSGFHPFATGDGLLLVGEVALLSRPDTMPEPRHRRLHIGRWLTRPHAGKLAVGAWYYTASFPDLSETLPSGDPVQHRGSGGVYLLGEETVWPAGHERPRALATFVQLGLGDGRVNQIGGYLGGGFTLTAPFSSRAQDELGLAVAAARNGSSFESARAAAGTTAEDETAVELTYLAQLGPWLAVQADAQYVIHPGGTGATRNALVLGLRVAASQ